MGFGAVHSNGVKLTGNATDADVRKNVEYYSNNPLQKGVGSLTSYKSWVQLTTITNYQNGGGVREGLITLSSIPADLEVGSAIRWDTGDSDVALNGSAYGIVTAISGNTVCVLFSVHGIPNGTTNVYYCAKGAYPSDLPNFSLDYWALVFILVVTTPSQGVWVTDDETIFKPLGTYSINCSLIGDYFYSGKVRLCSDGDPSAILYGINHDFVGTQSSPEWRPVNFDIYSDFGTQTMRVYAMRDNSNQFLGRAIITMMPVIET